MLMVHRTVLRRRFYQQTVCIFTSRQRPFHQCNSGLRRTHDPRVAGDEHIIEDDFLILRGEYSAPKHPIVLAHGLLGFDELHPAGSLLPGIQYWRGITEALSTRGVEVITAEVLPAGRVEERAKVLAKVIEERAGGKAVNIIAHSMGGLDARHMITRMHPPNVEVLSLTTIATPHRGSAFADYLFNRLGSYTPQVYKALDSFGLDTGAFRQLTETYMIDKFNPRTPDAEGVRYYSFGASFQPQLTSVFRQSHKIVEEAEGPNDGLVSVSSSRWGTYRGTLTNVSHLDLINWTNRLRWYFFKLTGHKERKFNAIAFYLSIADMLAKEGL